MPSPLFGFLSMTRQKKKGKRKYSLIPLSRREKIKMCAVLVLHVNRSNYAATPQRWPFNLECGENFPSQILNLDYFGQ